MAEAVPDLEQVLCTDAVAESTFLSEYYLRFRGVDAITQVVPLDEIEAKLSSVQGDARRQHAQLPRDAAGVCRVVARPPGA